MFYVFTVWRNITLWCEGASFETNNSKIEVLSTVAFVSTLELGVNSSSSMTDKIVRNLNKVCVESLVNAWNITYRAIFCVDTSRLAQYDKSISTVKCILKQSILNINDVMWRSVWFCREEIIKV